MRAICGVLGWLAVAAGVGCMLITFGEGGDTRDGGYILAGLCGVVAAPFLFAWWKLGVRDDREQQAGPGHRRLAEAPGEVLELGAGRRRWSLFLALSAGFVAIGMWAVLDGAGAAWIGVLFFGACGLVCAAQLVPGAAGVRLTPAGIAWRRFGRTTSYAWADVDGFRTFQVRTQYTTQTLVGCDLLAGDAPRRSMWGRLNRALSGVDVALPETYGREAEELASLLQHWRDRHAARDRMAA